MSLKVWITIGIMVGSTIGGYIPALWGDSLFSFASIFLSLIGGLVGIWAGSKAYQAMS